MISDANFGTLDEPVQKQRTYELPEGEWNVIVRLAQHLADREAKMPLQRRAAAFRRG